MVGFGAAGGRRGWGPGWGGHGLARWAGLAWLALTAPCLCRCPCLCFPRPAGPSCSPLLSLIVFALRPSPFALRPSPFALRPSPFALRPSPFAPAAALRAAPRPPPHRPPPVAPRALALALRP